MEHLTEILIIGSNFALMFATIVLAIVTGVDNRAMARIAALALILLSRRSPERIRRIVQKNAEK